MTQTDVYAIKASGDARKAAGDLDEALCLYDAAIALRPQYVAAHYERGNVLFAKAEFLKAANAFAAAWVQGRFMKEAGLMCGRSLVGGKLMLEACTLFDKLNKKDMDPGSALLYAEALRKENRIRDILAMRDILGHFPDDANWRNVMASAYLDMNDLTTAELLVASCTGADKTGFVIDILLRIYVAQARHEELAALLEFAIEQHPETDYYRGHRAVLEIMQGKPMTETRDPEKAAYAMIDSALYFKKKIENGLPLTGTSYQTYDLVKPEVPANGLILEFGVRNGHTIHHLAELYTERKVYGFDSFEGLPEAWHDEDAGSYSANGRIPVVPSNVEFTIGWFNETLPGFKRAHPQPVAFMNIDCDLYSSTKTIFDELDQQIVPGTVIVFDEYIVNKTWREDEYKAFQEWVVAHSVKYRYLAASFCTKQAAVQILARNTN